VKLSSRKQKYQDAILYAKEARSKIWTRAPACRDFGRRLPAYMRTKLWLSTALAYEQVGMIERGMKHSENAAITAEKWHLHNFEKKVGHSWGLDDDLLKSVDDESLRLRLSDPQFLTFHSCDKTRNRTFWEYLDLPEEEEMGWDSDCEALGCYA
jgi:hypothetical protein